MIGVKKSKYGRGVFSNVFISKDTIVEVSNIILIPNDETKYINKTILTMYSFYIKDNTECLCLGLGSLFNHSNKNNIITERDFDKQIIKFITNRDIDKDEELFIDYGYDIDEWKKQYLESK